MTATAEQIDLGGIVREREASDARLKACGADVIRAVLETHDVNLPPAVRVARAALVAALPAAAERGETR